MPFKGEVKPGIGWINRKSSDNLSSDYGRVCLTGIKDGKQLEDFWDKDVIDVIHTSVANQAAVKRYGGTNHAKLQSYAVLIFLSEGYSPL